MKVDCAYDGEEALNMAKAMNIPVLGLIENMSYVKCPDCGKEIKVYGESNIEEVAAEYKIPLRQLCFQRKQGPFRGILRFRGCRIGLGRS